MAEYTVGEALKKLMEHAGWIDRMHEYRIKAEWEAIAGATIAKYTTIQLTRKILFITTDVAPLKHELRLNKAQLMEKINRHFESRAVIDIKIG
jgi:predicted nucleic acid-binding Zn ribbon protein